MTPLHAVIARLEAATEGSRELDRRPCCQRAMDLPSYDDLWPEILGAALRARAALAEKGEG